MCDFRQYRIVHYEYRFINTAYPVLQESMNSTDNNGQPNQDSTPDLVPSSDQIYKYLMFGLSLPERTVRSTAAMVGGAIDQSANLLVPQAFRDSKTYNTFVKQMLDVVANDVGGVGADSKAEEAKPDSGKEEDADVEGYVAKKAVSTFIDLAGMATMHVSPLTVLAIVSDVAYGSKTYLNELTQELVNEGVIDEQSVINNAADLLDAIGSASSQTADALDQPPLSVDGLRETILQTQAAVADIDPALLIPQSEIESLWDDMQGMATREHVNLFEISSAMTMYTLEQVNTVSKGALTTIRVTGDLVDRHLFEHYRQGLEEINQQGIYAMVAQTSQPYLDAVWYNFAQDRPTITEDIVSGKMAGRVWDSVSNSVKGWMADEDESGDSPSE